MNNKVTFYLFLTTLFFCGILGGASAQVVKPFKQRTATATPGTMIYNLKGDFQMIGNSNLTLQNYSDNGNNSNAMIYVDIDGDNSTLNSSSATLEFPAETGVDHNCSEIVFAGLYWTGRSHNDTSPNSFIAEGTGTTTDRHNNETFNGYNLTITAADGGTGDNSHIATYTFAPANGGDAVVFRFRSWRTWPYTYHGYVTVQVGSGAATTVGGNLTSTSDNDYTFTFSSPYSINTGAENISIKSLTKKRTNNTIDNNYRASVTSGGKLLEKNKVQFKKAGQSYYTVTANAEDIYYPTTEHGLMYAAYAEVTDYVKQHGVGEYFVADMALRQGSGGSTGYYGGWGLIVIYKNTKMKWRDITIFDGYAYILHNGTLGEGETSYELPVQGFRTAQSGDIRIKMGLIAGEGDRSISGDFFRIKNRAGNWVNLSHNGNTINNFFNGSIPGTNPRNPQRLNNLGLDVAMFEVENSGNAIIGNNQSSTSFKYGTNQDTYIIPVIALAVDAYVPDVRAIAKFTTPTQSVNPGDTVEYEIQLSNASSEDVLGVALKIPIPFTATFVDGSIQNTYHSSITNPSCTYVPATLTTGSYIQWNVGNLPVTQAPATPPLLATLKFKLKATQDCNLLVMDDCLPRVALEGKVSGKGANSNQDFSDMPFITGYTESAGGCDGVPLYGPLDVKIDMEGYDCSAPGMPEVINNKIYAYCEQSNVNIYDSIKGFYPTGSRFFNAVVNTVANNGLTIIKPAQGATEYTSDNDFPHQSENIGMKTYYVVPFGASTCKWQFVINVEPCSYWVGSVSTDWADASNWSKNRVPANGEKIEFATADNHTTAAQRDLILDQNRVIGSLVNTTDFSVIIPANKALTVNGTVEGSDTYAKAGKLYIKAEANTPNGSLILAGQPQDKPVFGTVEMYSKANKSATPMTWTDNIEGSPTQNTEYTSYYRWQYFGIPVEMLYPDPTFYGAYLREYNETYNGDNTQFYQKWRDLDNTSRMEAFKGYEITREEPVTYVIKGRLVHGSKELTLTRNAPEITTASGANKYYGLGQNIFGNSYTAAINIANMVFPNEVEPTVYIYNTGSFSEWGDGSTVNDPTDLPGSYLSIPKSTASTIWNGQIPSMQGFLLRFKSSELTTNTGNPVNVTLTYNAVENPSVSGNSNPQKAPALSAANTADEVMGNLQISLWGAKTSDVMWLIETPEATSNFEYGYDGEKIVTMSPTATIFAEVEQNKALQVSSSDRIDGSFISFKSNNDTEYSMKIVKTKLDHYPNLYLIDLLTRTAVRLDDETVYNFTSEVANHKSKRFMIASTPDVSKLNNTFVTEMLDVYMSDNNTIVVNNLTNSQADVTIYDVTGKQLLQQKAMIGANYISVNLNAGVYIVSVKSNDIHNNVKVVIK